jgi:hypothetical protein
LKIGAKFGSGDWHENGIINTIEVMPEPGGSRGDFSHNFLLTKGITYPNDELKIINLC